MKKNKLMRFGGIALAAAVLVTGSWYTSQETGTTTIPQLVEYVDTDDGSIVIPEEEVPLASKPVVKVKKTTKKTTKKSKMKAKATKTAKTTSRSKKTKTTKKESSTQKVSTETTVLTTVVSATKKKSNIKTVTTTVETTVKTTTTNKPKAATTKTTTAAKSTSTTAKTTTASSSSNTMQTVSTVNVRTIAPKAHANVLKAFENLEFKIEINPTVNYSGYFSVKAHSITLKKNSSDTIYHELGHFVGWLAGNVDTSSAFTKIYNAEKGALKSANYQYVTQNSSEYFAESYKEYVLSPQNLKATRPQTYEYIANAVGKITDARTATIKAAYMKAYWS